MERKYVSATELATLGKCERLAVLEARYGSRPSVRTRQARQRGDREHLRHHREALAFGRTPATPDRRCFIASAVYGPDAWQTNYLRTWRDRHLMPTWWGRLMIGAYYALSPALVRRLPHWPRLRRLVQAMLDRGIRWMR